MQKIQILFPDPLMKEIKARAEIEDRAVSEIVRRAVERFLSQQSAVPNQARPFPTFRGGGVLVSAPDLKEEIYRDDQ